MDEPNLDQLIPEALNALGDESGQPVGLADAALARANGRRKKKLAISTAAAVVGVIAVSSLILSSFVSKSAGEGATSMDVLYVDSYLAQEASGSVVAHALDPSTGRYERTAYSWALPHDGRMAVLDQTPDTRRGSLVAGQRVGVLDRESRTTKWYALPRPAWAAFWSPDGRRLLVSLLAPSVEEVGGHFIGYAVINLSSGNTSIVELEEPAQRPLQWMPNGQTIVGDFERGVRFYDASGELLDTLDRPGSIPVPAAVSADGTKILITAEHTDGMYLVVNVESGQVVDRVAVQGIALGWLCHDELLVWRKAEGELLGRDLPLKDSDEPPLQSFGSDVIAVWPKQDLVYDSC